MGRSQEAAGIRVTAEHDVLVLQLEQAIKGPLGLLTRQMAEANVNVEAAASRLPGLSLSL